MYSPCILFSLQLFSVSSVFCLVFFVFHLRTGFEKVKLAPSSGLFQILSYTFLRNTDYVLCHRYPQTLSILAQLCFLVVNKG